MGPVKQQSLSSRPRRVRTQHPLDIRSWVIGKDPETIYAMLVKRFDIVAEYIERHYASIRHGLHSQAELTLKALFGKDVLDKLPPLSQLISPEHVKGAGRWAAYTAISDYWRNHRDGTCYLPRVVIHGAPWEVGPDEIHVWDLDEEQLRTALTEIERLPDLYRDVLKQALAHAPAEPRFAERRVEEALREIRRDRAIAWENPFVHWVIFEVLKIAWHSANLDERETAVRALKHLFGAFYPDLAQHVSWREETLLPLLQEYQELRDKVFPLHGKLRKEGPSGALLRDFRRLDRRLTMKNLRAFRRQPGRAVTLTILAGRHRPLKPKRLSELLTLAGKAWGIRQAWEQFQALLTELPLPEQERLSSAFAPFALPAQS